MPHFVLPTDALAAPLKDRRSLAFLLVFGLANAGGVIGYLPLLSLLLPIKVEALAGEVRLDLLTAALLSGALAASLSNIGFGWLSDLSLRRGIGRRTWIVAGGVATVGAYGLLALAQSPATVIVGVILFQVALNAMLAPLLAIMADEIPDEQKGLASGMLALGQPVGSAFAATLVSIGFLGASGRLMMVPAFTILLMVPLLLTRARPIAATTPPSMMRQQLRIDLAIAWAARLLVQIAGNTLALYLLYYFESVLPDVPPAELAPRVAQILTLAHVLPLPIVILIGRLSDRIGRRKPFLIGAALVTASGLTGMALAGSWTQAVIAFSVHAIGWAIFVSLHSAFAMQLLPSPDYRGRDLGFINLANTLPALVGPLLAWLLATPRDFDLLLSALALLTLGGGLLILAARGREPAPGPS